MADQVVENVAGALAVCQRRAAHVVSIKATKMGTLDECRRVVEVCEAFGVRVHVGGSAGPSGADAGQLQLAATLPWIDEEAELGESLAIAEDLSSGLIIRDGRAYLNTAPGLGLTLAADSAEAEA
jgi:L-alanine-DL-glutamate epimerase-like enolase superfamily enzyme